MDKRELRQQSSLQSGRSSISAKSTNSRIRSAKTIDSATSTRLPSAAAAAATALVSVPSQAKPALSRPQLGRQRFASGAEASQLNSGSRAARPQVSGPTGSSTPTGEQLAVADFDDDELDRMVLEAAERELEKEEEEKGAARRPASPSISDATTADSLAELELEPDEAGGSRLSVESRGGALDVAPTSSPEPRSHEPDARNLQTAFKRQSGTQLRTGPSSHSALTQTGGSCEFD